MTILILGFLAEFLFSTLETEPLGTQLVLSCMLLHVFMQENLMPKAHTLSS